MDENKTELYIYFPDFKSSQHTPGKKALSYTLGINVVAADYSEIETAIALCNYMLHAHNYPKSFMFSIMQNMVITEA